MKIKSSSIPETNNLAKDFLNTIKKGKAATVVGLQGNLGSGKTIFVKAVAEYLGLKQTVSSPTFVIEKIYQLSPTSGVEEEGQNYKYLIHIDAYRLEKGEELLTLGWKEISKDPNNLIFIEWPENVKDVLSDDVKYIDFRFIDENTREIIY